MSDEDPFCGEGLSIAMAMIRLRKLSATEVRVQRSAEMPVPFPIVFPPSSLLQEPPFTRSGVCHPLPLHSRIISRSSFLSAVFVIPPLPRCRDFEKVRSLSRAERAWPILNFVWRGCSGVARFRTSCVRPIVGIPQDVVDHFPNPSQALYQPRADYIASVQRQGMCEAWRSKIVAWFEQVSHPPRLKKKKKTKKKKKEGTPLARRSSVLRISCRSVSSGASPEFLAALS